jgi:hypothetical protein
VWRHWSWPRKPRSRGIEGIGDGMRAALRCRLERLEVVAEPKKPQLIRSGYLKTLPKDYVGERHVVIVKREPGASGNFEWCEFEERPDRRSGGGLYHDIYIVYRDVGIPQSGSHRRDEE